LADQRSFEPHPRVASTYVIHLAVGILAATLWSAPADAAMCVNVDLRFASGNPSRLLVETLQEESTAIWAPYGVDLHWQSNPCAVEDASFNVVVERHRRHPLVHRPGVVLGATEFQLTSIDEIPIWVDYDAVEQTIRQLAIDQLLNLLGHPDVGSEEMGRAFGRVVAHEIGHVILGLPNHQRTGLMRRSFEASELVQRQRTRYRLSVNEVSRLQHRSHWFAADRNRAAGEAGHGERGQHPAALPQDTGDK
jgi:hypothetical protein